MTTKPKRSFTAEQKAEAVKIVEQSGKSVSDLVTVKWTVRLSQAD
jgi:transposase-like protein